jgi:dUTP pyrophosphatase
MTIIGGKKLRRLIEQGAVKDYLDLDVQLQPNGFDLTTEYIESFQGHGIIDYDNTERLIPAGKTVGRWDGRIPPGVYRVGFRERITIPRNMCVITQPRSSLLRMGGDIGSAWGDAGYEGKYQALLHVHNPHGIIVRPNARLAQIAFCTLSEELAHHEGYKGAYQGR